MTAIATLLSDFEILDDWEDRYRHVIDLGRELPDMPPQDHQPENKVMGCASQVWITSRIGGPTSDPVLTFEGDSDALIVKGLIAIAFMIYSAKPAREIIATDVAPILEQLGLRDHLTPQRSNGLASMVERVRTDARAALASA